MPPFQQWFVELVSIISNLLVGIAAIAAIIGLWQWRAELIGKAKFESARKIILLAFQFRDELRSARMPFPSAGESSQRVRHEGESPRISQVLDEHDARLQRLRPVQDIIRKVMEAGWEAEVLLDKEDAQLIKPLENIYNELRVAINHHFDEMIIRARSSTPYLGLPEPKQDEIKAIVNGVADDAFSKQVDIAIENLKERLKRYIR